MLTDAEAATELFVYDRVYYDAVKEDIQNFRPIPGGGVHTWNAHQWWIQP